MSLTEFEQRVHAALHADAARIEGSHPDQPRQRPAPAARERERAWGRTLAIPAGVVACALAAAFVVTGLRSPRPAIAAVAPPLLIFDRLDAPPVQPLLANLAVRAARQRPLQPPPHEYVYIAQESWNLSVSVGASVSAAVVPVLTETWSSPAGPDLAIQRSAAPLAPGPLTPSEEAQARHAVALGKPVRQRLASREVFGSLAALPTEPRALFRQLADPGHWPARSGWPTTLSSPRAVGVAMKSLVNYLDYSAPIPTLLANLYRMLALLPGVSDAGWVTDRAGRRGIAIAVPTGGKGGWHSFRLIVNPANGRLLDVEDIQLDQSAVPIKPPFVFSYVIYINTRVVRNLGGRNSVA
jgi:hypothetical protein